LIWLQIWHCGRSTNPESQGGLEAWGPSPIAIRGKNFFTAEKLDYPVPHEMTADEIEQVVKEFRVGAENAKRAGFDGVQLHGANGYLVD
jgi:N-ethylmaleimide reductase